MTGPISLSLGEPFFNSISRRINVLILSTIFTGHSHPTWPAQVPWALGISSAFHLQAGSHS